MKLIFLLVSLLCLYVSGLAQNTKYAEPDSFKVYPSTSGYIKVYNKFTKKYGFIDEGGNELILFIYSLANDFKDGHARVVLNNKFGIVNANNETTVPHEYTNLREIVNKRCQVRNDSGKFGVIDLNNEVIVPFVYDHIYSNNNDIFLGIRDDERVVVSSDTTYSLGRASDYYIGHSSGNFLSVDGPTGYMIIKSDGSLLQDTLDYVLLDRTGYHKFIKDRLRGYLNVDGNVLIPNEYTKLGSFSEGLCPAMIDYKWGYIDTLNTLVVRPLYATASKFIFQKAIVSRDEEYYLIDRNGNRLFSESYDHLRYIEKDSVYVSRNRDKEIVYNKNFTRISEEGMSPHARKSSYFHSGLMLVEKDSLFGFIDKSGVIIIDIGFKFAKPFNNGYAVVGYDQLGLIDALGKQILNFEYDKINIKRVSNLIEALKKDSITILTSKGNKVGAFYGQGIHQVNNNHLVLKQKDKYILISGSGDIIFDTPYDSIFIQTFSNGAVFEENEKCGFYSFKKQKVVLEPAFDAISGFYGGHSLIVEVDGKSGLYNIEGDEILKPEFNKIDAMIYGLLVYKGDKVGLFDKVGNKLLATKYDSIKRLEGKRFELYKGGKRRVVDLKKKYR